MMNQFISLIVQKKTTFAIEKKKNLMQPLSKAGKPLPNSINSIYIFQIVGYASHA